MAQLALPNQQGDFTAPTETELKLEILRAFTMENRRILAILVDTMCLQDSNPAEYRRRLGEMWSQLVAAQEVQDDVS